MEGQVIGPMLVNSTPTCYNSSLLPSTFPNLTEITVLHREVGSHFQRKKLSVSLYQMFFETGIMIARVWNEILRDLEGKWRHILRARKAYTALNFFCCFFPGSLTLWYWYTAMFSLANSVDRATLQRLLLSETSKIFHGQWKPQYEQNMQHKLLHFDLTTIWELKNPQIMSAEIPCPGHRAGGEKQRKKTILISAATSL